MSKWENIQFIIGANLIFQIPAVFLAIEKKWLFLGLLIFGVFLWYFLIQFFVCTACINLSCVLNRVPRKEREEFLKNNPVMYEAWRKSGYKFKDVSKEN